MKRSILMLLILICIGVLLTLPPPTSFSSQGDKKLVRKLLNSDSPVEIAKVKLKGKGLATDLPFEADDDWMRELSVELKNVSGKEVVYVKVELDFPTDDSGANLVVLPLEYGRQPQDGEEGAAVSPLRPGESATLTVQGWSVDYLRRKIREKGGGAAVNTNKAVLFVSQVWFDADTMWSQGTTFVRDPADKTNWKPAGKPETSPPGDREHTRR